MQRTIAIGSILAFCLPAVAETIGTSVFCGDDFTWKSRTPNLLLLVLVLAGIVGVACLAVASGPPRRVWLVAPALLCAVVVGSELEIFISIASLTAYCAHRNVFLLYLQTVLGVFIAVVAAIGLRYGLQSAGKASGDIMPHASERAS